MVIFNNGEHVIICKFANYKCIVSQGMPEVVEYANLMIGDVFDDHVSLGDVYDQINNQGYFYYPEYGIFIEIIKHNKQ